MTLIKKGAVLAGIALTVLTVSGNSCNPSVPDPSIIVEQPDHSTLIIRGSSFSSSATIAISFVPLYVDPNKEPPFQARSDGTFAMSFRSPCFPQDQVQGNPRQISATVSARDTATGKVAFATIKALFPCINL